MGRIKLILRATPKICREIQNEALRRPQRTPHVDAKHRSAYNPSGFTQIWCNMPSTSDKQRRFMAAAAHDPKFAKKAGVPMKVTKEYNQADKGPKLAKAMKNMTKDEA